MTTGATCIRCGRKLRAAASIAAGYGRFCRRQVEKAIRAEALDGFTAEQAEKAAEAVREGAIVPTGQAGWFRAVSGDGTTAYLVTATSCTCPARKPCKHMASARLIEAVAAARRPVRRAA